MKNVLIAILLIVCTHYGSGQSIKDRLNKSTATCETVSLNVDKIIRTIDNIDSLNVLMDIWGNSCGKPEALSRYELLDKIESNELDNNMIVSYLEKYLDYYKYRNDVARKENYKEIYNYSSSYFEYLVPGGNYDQFTSNWASNLISLTKENTDAYLLCLLFSNQLDQFTELTEDGTLRDLQVVQAMSKSPYYERKSDGNFKLEVSSWIPISRLRNQFNTSPRISLSFGAPIGLDYRAEFKFGFTPFIKNDSLSLTFDEVDYLTDHFLGINFGIVGIREYRINADYHFDILTEISLNALGSNIPDPNGEEDNSTHGIKTFDLGLGFNFKKFIRNTKNTIGWHSSFHFAPYNLDSQLNTPTGNSYLLTGLYVSF